MIALEPVLHHKKMHALVHCRLRLILDQLVVWRDVVLYLQLLDDGLLGGINVDLFKHDRKIVLNVLNEAHLREVETLRDLG